MTVVTASIDIEAPREEVWETALDPQRLDQWVTIHRKVNESDDGPLREGYEMQQTLCVRGVNFKVRWKLTESDRPERATWEGRGPAHSYARTGFRLAEADGGATRFEYENEFHPPGGILGAAAGRALMGGVSQREANRSLQNLKRLLER
jgi:carbon monoxide dehydrogenase subunit G